MEKEEADDPRFDIAALDPEGQAEHCLDARDRFGRRHTPSPAV
jgi:hypothetical protein